MGMPRTIAPHDLLLVMGGTEERLQLVLGQPTDSGHTLLASRQWTVPGQSVKFLLPGLKATLDEFGLTTADIAKIACVRGPGSFTGLRLVLAAAEGVAAGHGLPLAGLDYLPLLAKGPGPLLEGVLHVVTYARRGLVYSQSFDCPSCAPLNDLAALSLAEAGARMAKLGTGARIMGSGVRKNPEFFTELTERHPGYVLVDATFDNPAPEVLLAEAAQAEFGAQSIEPVYVRPTDAEDNLDQIAAKRGLDPIEARARLKALQNS